MRIVTVKGEALDVVAWRQRPARCARSRWESAARWRRPGRARSVAVGRPTSGWPPSATHHRPRRRRVDRLLGASRVEVPSPAGDIAPDRLLVRWRQRLNAAQANEVDLAEGLRSLRDIVNRRSQHGPVLLTWCLPQRLREIADGDKTLLNRRGEQAAGRPRMGKGRCGAEQGVRQPVDDRGPVGHGSIDRWVWCRRIGTGDRLRSRVPAGTSKWTTSRSHRVRPHASAAVKAVSSACGPPCSRATIQRWRSDSGPLCRTMAWPNRCQRPASSWARMAASGQPSRRSLPTVVTSRASDTARSWARASDAEPVTPSSVAQARIDG
jgi:hypothetical protein